MCQYSPEQWNVESKIVYVNDNWMMHQMVFTFAGAIEYFIDKEWDLIEHMVNFYHIQDKDHEGQWAAKVFVNTVVKRGGLDKMSTHIYFYALHE